MKVSKGDIIAIGEDRYDVLKVMNEIDRYDSKKKALVGKHLEIEMHKLGDSSLYPTHILKIYPSRTVLLNMVQEKVKYADKPRERGFLFNYTNGKEIPLDSIKVEPGEKIK